MNFETIEIIQPAEHIVQLTLSRPEAANALNTLMAQEIAAAFDLPEFKNARCIVLTGAGARAFCAGADLKERNGMNLKEWKEQHKYFESTVLSISSSSVPVIAVVNGAAFGGGLEMILAADFAYAAEGVRFSFSEVCLGIIPGLGGLHRLVQAVGMPRAKEIVMTGEVLLAQEFLEWGLINKTFAHKELYDKVLQGPAKAIAANAPLAVAAAKSALQAVPGRTLESWTELEHRAYYSLVETEDRREGILAFNEKRTAIFQGR